MGYFYNNLGTLVMGVFAAILTGLWPVFVGIAPILNFVFMMAVPISWFITFMFWIVQKGQEASLHNTPKQIHKYTSDGKISH
jgi:hypothetical protein